MKRAYVWFEKKYSKRTNYLKSERKLLGALRDYEKLLRTVGPAKPLLYYFYTKELDSSNSNAEARLNKLSNELTNYENKVVFFDLALGKISSPLQKKFLKALKLKKYHYFLKKTFETSKYDLSEPEEKILNLKSMPSHSLWVDGVEKLLNKQTVRFRGKALPIVEAQNKVNNLKTKERRTLQDAIMEKLYGMSDFAESEINAVVLNKKINDELRGLKEPYSATILGYENDEKSVLQLVDTITKHFRIANRFYKLKAKLLKLKHLEYADRSAHIGKTSKKINFIKAYTMLHEVFAQVDPAYAEILDRFLKNGQIDVYPNVGKSGGAYCSSNLKTSTLVLLNHTNDFKSFLTFAHEMGHAVHAEMSKKQPLLYQGHSTAVAETASTLFEQLAFERVFQTLSDKEKIVALHDKINDDISTIFRQIAFFNFELELHNTIREKGALSKEKIVKLLNKHMKKYLGPACKLKDLDGYFFVQVSHFRRFFYVYSYAYGQLISKALCQKFIEDNIYRKEIRSFLTAGQSKSPEQIFRDIGIDTTKPDFFKQGLQNKGLQNIEKDVKRLEKLTTTKKKR